MAAQIGLPFQDQNFGLRHKGASVVGKMNVAKPQKKGGGLGGRKPLGEISNSANIFPPQASKKSSAFFKEAMHGESNKKSTVSTTSGKVQTRSRNALSDISNSGKAHAHEASKNKLTMKPSAVDEEHLFPVSIAEEKFLHDHRKCIKAQNNPMDVEEFLAIVGLTNASSKHFESPRPLKSSKTKPENRSFDLELLEIPEDEYLSEQKLNSPICRTPKSPTCRSTLWEDCDSIDFKLTETP